VHRDGRVLTRTVDAASIRLARRVELLLPFR
jgi:hypothetical protein